MTKAEVVKMIKESMGSGDMADMVRDIIALVPEEVANSSSEVLSDKDFNQLASIIAQYICDEEDDDDDDDEDDDDEL